MIPISGELMSVGVVLPKSAAAELRSLEPSELLDRAIAETPAVAALMAKAKFVYSVPNYSNPTGVLVPEERRIALLDAVTKAGTWLVEDDPYLTMQLDGPPPPSILSTAARRGGRPYDGPVIYLGTAPKSNAGYVAYGAAKRSAKQHGSLTPPMHILNAPTKLMKEIGYGSGYQYDHDAEDDQKLGGADAKHAVNAPLLPQKVPPRPQRVKEPPPWRSAPPRARRR